MLVGVADDESGRSEGKNRDMPAKLIVIKGRLMMDEIGLQGLASQGRVQCIGHQIRVVPTALDVAAQLLVKLCHAPILSPAFVSHLFTTTHPHPGTGPSSLHSANKAITVILVTPYIRVADEVANALAESRPVVALESTIISHGLPRPENLRVAIEVEDIVRAAGAVPATIAMLAGVVHIGLSKDLLDQVANRDDVVKVSVRDIATVAARGGNGATTVAATSQIAARAGIEVFATGGLGGVHREARASWDESADLTTMGTTPMTIVCAGVKSILDVGATLERLETLNVGVLGYGTKIFPGFYLSDSGHVVDWAVSTPAEVAEIMEARRAFGIESALVVAYPLAESDQLDPDLHDRVLHEGLKLAAARNVVGKGVTPFLLDHFHRATHGASLIANERIIVHNADLAAQIAVARSERSA